MEYGKAGRNLLTYVPQVAERNWRRWFCHPNGLAHVHEGFQYFEGGKKKDCEFCEANNKQMEATGHSKENPFKQSHNEVSSSQHVMMKPMIKCPIEECPASFLNYEELKFHGKFVHRDDNPNIFEKKHSNTVVVDPNQEQDSEIPEEDISMSSSFTFDDKKIKCPIRGCNSSFSEKRFLIGHGIRIHKDIDIKLFNIDIKITCSLCNAKVKKISQHKPHCPGRQNKDKEDKNNAKHNCEKCGQMFTRLYTLKQHTEKCTGIKKSMVKCEKCQKNFTTRYFNDSKHKINCGRKNNNPIKEPPVLNAPAQEVNESPKKIKQSERPTKIIVPDRNQRSIIANVISQSLIDQGGIDHQGIIFDGLYFAFERLQVRLRTPDHFVQGDGNCAPRAWALGEGCPDILNEDTWTMKARELRREAVTNARQQIQQNTADMDMLLNFFPEEDDIDAALAELEQDGQYAQNMGDLMCQMLSSSRGIPLIMLNLQTNTVEYIFPETIFHGNTRSELPLIFVRRNDHFEILCSTPNQAPRLIQLINYERTRRRQPHMPNQSTDMEKSVGTPLHQSTPKKKHNNNEKGVTQDSSIIDANIEEDEIISNNVDKTYKLSEKVFDRKYGTRGMVRDNLCHVPLHYQTVDILDNQMDPILMSVSKQIEQRDKVTLKGENVLTTYFKDRNCTSMTAKYQKLNIMMADDSCIPKNVLITFKRYLLPWIIVHLDEVYNATLDDLLDLNKEIYLNKNSVKENMESHQNTLPETDKSILNAWKHWCEAIVHNGDSRVGSPGGPSKNAVSLADYHYTNVSKYCTKLQNIASKTAKVDRHARQAKSSKIPAMNELIIAWLTSDERRFLIRELEETSKNTNNGEFTIRKEVFSRLTEFVAMELLIGGPVRAGAFMRMKLKVLRRIRPIWNHAERTTDPFSVPENGCSHQKHNNANTLGLMGITGTGGQCCTSYAIPVAYAIENLSDKGALYKKKSFLIIPPEPFEWLQQYILIRESFFANKHDIPSTASQNHQDARVFVTYTGQPINNTQGNTLRLHRLNEAVFGRSAGIIITPQMIRKWNTTFLSRHPDADIRNVRGVATGHSDFVFEEHYNLETYAQMRDATLELRQEHYKDCQTTRKLSEMVGINIAIQLKAEVEAEAQAQVARKIAQSKLDQTSKTTPIDGFTRSNIKLAISKMDPNLWAKSTGENYLTEHNWKKALLNLIFIENDGSRDLQKIIVDLYRGNKDERLRRYSAAEHHLTQENGKNTKLNSPIWSVLGLIYRSACANTRKRPMTGALPLGDQDTSDYSNSSSEGEDE